ncbi:MAG: hypothetical protein ACJASX_003955 [Limisphaerales bacterium]|jgi:hypothetical protein
MKRGSPDLLRSLNESCLCHSLVGVTIWVHHDAHAHCCLGLPAESRASRG